MLNTLSCPHFNAARCRSCEWLDPAQAVDYAAQITQKEAELGRLLAPFAQQAEFLPSRYSAPSQFRNKAKMVVSGSVERPILGILRDPFDPDSAIDLTDCPLYPAHFADIFALLRQFIGRAGLVPYNIAKKKGELKYILLSESRFNGALMIRFVLKSELKRPLVERELPTLLAKLPQNSVITLNIQPQHAAILEGEQEIFLTENHTIEENFNQIPLFIRPQGFFQTNPDVAAALYAQAQQWTKDLPVSTLWDLFCGVGGFGLHCAKALQDKNGAVQLTGIEISAAAIASATRSAEKLGLKNVHFASLDSAQFALSSQENRPDLVIVNPPRRGIGKTLAQFLNEMGAPFLIYSSCNAQSMAKDFAYLSAYRLEKVQLFDMFPHTAHFETLTFLRRI